MKKQVVVLASLILPILGCKSLKHQPPEPETMALRYTHNMNLNGERARAVASGTFDFSSGGLTVDADIDRYIDGYAFWFTSVVTQTIFPLAIASREIDGARNLRSLGGSRLSFLVRNTAQDDFADVTTEMRFWREGETLIANLESSGQANYPLVVGMQDEPLVLSQKPLPGGGFVETGNKNLILEDGSSISASVNARYEGVKLPRAQTRTIWIEVLEESDDRRKVKLRYVSTVRSGLPPAIEEY